MALRGKRGCKKISGDARMINETRSSWEFQVECVAARIYNTTIRRIKMNVHQMFASIIKTIGIHYREIIVRMAIIEAAMAHHLLGVLHIGGQIANPDDSGIPEIRHRLRDQGKLGARRPLIN